MDPAISRRAALTAGAVGVGAVALGACSPSSSQSDVSQAPGKELVTLADVPVGRARAVKLPDGTPAVVARPTASSAACFSAICTHQGCTVAVNGAKLDCPCHQSQFNALTGAVLQGPAAQPLPRIPVKVSGGKVFTA